MECRVLDIMRRDAQKDPATEPEALYAGLLINQVSFITYLFFICVCLLAVYFFYLFLILNSLDVILMKFCF